MIGIVPMPSDVSASELMLNSNGDATEETAHTIYSDNEEAYVGETTDVSIRENFTVRYKTKDHISR